MPEWERLRAREELARLGRGETSVVRWSSEPGPEQLVIMQDCNMEWFARRFALARGFGVAVQPTPGSALKEGNPQQ
jgi:hypothetical protein